MVLIRRDYNSKPSNVALPSEQQPQDPNICESKSTIKDIDEDCLFIIFDHLSLEDLCAVAETNKQYRSLTRLYFLLYRDELDIDVLSVNEKFDFDLAERLLNIFGDLINTLIISAQHFDDDTQRKMYQLINEKCFGCLDKLLIEHLDLKSSAIDELVPLLQSICDFDDPFVFYLDDVDDNVNEVELIVHANVLVLLPQFGA